jgi:predicted TIM-barrel fold metal-dependent hydrolase
MKKGFKVLDSDMHIIEPPDLWQRYIDPEFKDKAPVGSTRTVGDLFMQHPDGRPWGRNPRNVQDYGERQRGQSFEQNQLRFKPYADAGWTGEAQLKAMDEEGIDVAVIYPSRGLFAMTEPDLEPRFAAAIARAYNNWLYEWCAPDRSRLVGAGMLSPFDIEDTVSEASRCAKELDFRGVFLRPNVVKGRNWHDPYYEPLWSVLEEVDIPLGFHEGDTSALPHVGEQFGTNIMLSHVFSHPVEQMLAAASFCGGGILERHPNLKVAFLEGNCSWLPFFLWRLDEHWERSGDVHAPDLKMAPSEYFKRQCFASAEPDEDPVKYVIDWMGNERLVFSTDFPHGDSKFPQSVDRFLEINLSDEDKRKILWDNCAQYYGITK